jgi:hypothetical protein
MNIDQRPCFINVPKYPNREYCIANTPYGYFLTYNNAYKALTNPRIFEGSKDECVAYAKKKNIILKRE